MQKIETSGDLVQGWQIPNSWEKGEGEEDLNRVEYFV
jgi:hypothetical protein